jgi:hypothetical protein
MRKERMLQRLGGGDPLLRVQRQTPLEEVDKMVELAAFRVRHARRGGQEPCPQVARGFDAREGSNGGLDSTE